MTNHEFEQNFVAHRELVTSFFKHKYKLKIEEVEDIVQNALVKIHKRFVNNDLVCEFPKKYLFNAIINCIYEYKARKPHCKHEFSFTQLNIELPEFFMDSNVELDSSFLSENIVENNYIKEELQYLIDKLATTNPEMSEALNMFYFDSLTTPEIAEKLNIPVNTVKTRLHRGKSRLKSLLTQDMVLSAK